MSVSGPESKPLSLEGSLVAERYQVECLLGEGAMGRVYRARHVHMQKVVALKVLHKQTTENAELVTRFEREAVALGRINHQNVAAASDFGRLPDQSFYLVLEYVSGQSLGELLEREGALSVERSIAIADQVFSALAAAHRAGIIHRDLKPDNVMLLAPDPARASSALGPSDVVKVLDFGLAKLASADPVDTQLTQAGAIYGTPQYMSPEQASGADVDARADLYAAGVIFYEMLAGKPPFEAEQIMPLLLKHMTEPPPPLPGHVPSALRKIVLKLLEKKPADRFATADDALAELREATLGAQRPALPSGTGLAMPSAEEARTQLGKVAQTSVASLSAWLTRRIPFRGREWPVWLPLGALSLVGALSVGLLRPKPSEVRTPDKVSLPEQKATPKAVSPPPSDADPELLKVLDAAKLGSDPALYALEHREEAQRSDAEWMALTQAYLMRRDVDKALEAYSRALIANRAHASDMTTLGALRYLVDDEKFSVPILEFVAKRLPDVAADFLFDVWSRTSAKTKATERAKELLDSSEVRAHLSEALELAFAVREAGDCEKQTELLPKVVLRGDERTLPRLRDMKKDPACAKTAGKSLDEALTQVALRKAPRFPLLRRWRWKTAGGAAPGETVPEEKPEKKKKYIFF